MNWHFYIALLTAVALSLPLVMIVLMRLYRNRSFAALGFHYLMTFAYNLVTLGAINIPPDWETNMALANNFLDIPLLMIFLLYFTKSWRLTKQLLTFTLVYIGFEALTVAFSGFNMQANTIILGPGIILIMVFAFYFFMKQVQSVEGETSEPGKILLLSSLLFSYGSYAFIYLIHYVLQLPYLNDVFLVYYFVTTIASLVMACGIWIERKKITRSVVDEWTETAPVNLTAKKEGEARVIKMEENEFKYK